MNSIFSFFRGLHNCELFRQIRNRENNIFDNIILIIIALSAVLIGIETDRELFKEHHRFFIAIDQIIVFIFVVEVFFKWYVFYPKPWRYFCDPWNVFDFTIVAISVLPLLISDSVNTEAAVVFRIFRIFRILRVFRFISVLKPLKILVATILRSLPSMGYVAILLMIIFYAYGVIGVFLFANTDPEHFSSLSVSLLTLFQTITGEAWPDILSVQLSQGYAAVGVIYFVSFIIIGSMIILNLFIGIIVSELESLKEIDSQGKQEIYENNHIVVVGWNSRIINLVYELAENAEGEKQIIAFLADKKKKAMENHFKQNFTIKSPLKFIFRTGSPLSNYDLKMIDIEKASQIIILGNDDHFSDLYEIKSLISIVNYVGGSTKLPNISIPLKDVNNCEIAKMIGGNNLSVILVKKITANFIIQASRHPGLSVVYEELFSFYGHEIHSKYFRRLIGKKFAEVINNFKTSSVIGIIKNERDVKINPDFNYILDKGDKILSIAESDKKYLLDGKVEKINKLPATKKKNSEIKKSERVLIIGGNEIVYQIIKEISSYQSILSDIDLYYDKKYFELNYETLSTKENNTNIKKHYLNTVSREKLESIEFDKYDYIILLSYYDTLKNEEADTLSLVTLMYLRETLKKRGIKKSITTEMTSSGNIEFLRGEDLEDFIVSDKIDSLFLAQYSQNTFLPKVFDELFKAEGTEIYFKPANEYVEINKKLELYDVSRKCNEYGELFIGYKIKSMEGETRLSDGIEINPDKSNDVKFDKGDKIIVLAEAEIRSI